MKVWQETGHTHFTKLYTKSWGIIVVTLALPQTLRWIYTAFTPCIAFTAVNAFTAFLLKKYIWRNSCGVEVRDLKLNHAETDLFGGECQPALLLHWNGNRPAAPLILVDKVTVGQETGHAHFTKLYTKSWGIIVVTLALPQTLRWIYTAFTPCIAFTAVNAFTEFLLKIIWRNSCGVEVGDLKLNHAETDLFSGECQPALLLHWNGNRPAAPLILVDKVTVGQETGHAYFTKLYTKSWGIIVVTLALPQTLRWIYTAFTPCIAFTAVNAFTAFLLKIIWRNSCGVEVRDLKLNHAETDLFSGECQPALLLHWNGNRPAAPLILVDKVTVWQETGHAHFTKLHTKYWGIIVVTLALPQTLRWIYTAFTPCIAFTAVNAFTEFLLGIIWRNSCGVEVRDLKLNHAETDLFSGECQPALLLHWNGNRPAAPLILVDKVTVWQETGHAHFTKLYTKSWGIIVVTLALPQTLRWIYTAFTPCIAFTAVNAFTAFLLKIIWRNSSGVEVRDLKLNHAETDLFSGECQPALLLHWNGNRPAAPLILVDKVTVGQETGHAHFTKLYTKSWGIIVVTLALPQTLRWIYTAFTPCIAFTAVNAFTEFLLKIIWRNSCGVEVTDLKLNHAETDLFSGECQPALLLHWNGNRPAAPLILVDKVTVWQETGHAHFTKLYTKSWGIIVVTLALPKHSDGSTLHSRRALHSLQSMNSLHSY